VDEGKDCCQRAGEGEKKAARPGRLYLFILFLGEFHAAGKKERREERIVRVAVAQPENKNGVGISFFFSRELAKKKRYGGVWNGGFRTREEKER